MREVGAVANGPQFHIRESCALSIHFGAVLTENKP